MLFPPACHNLTVTTVNTNHDARSVTRNQTCERLRGFGGQRSDNDAARAGPEQIFNITDCSQTTAKLYGDSDGLNNALCDKPINGLFVSERAVEVDDMQHPGSIGLKHLCDGDRVSPVRRHCVLTPLGEPDAFSAAKINRRNYEHMPSRIPPTQLVDCSYLAYNEGTRPAFPNPTNAVGGSFILGLQRRNSTCRPESHQRSWWIVHTRPTTKGLDLLSPNPTNAVGGSFILGLQRRDSTCFPESHQRSWWIVHTRPTSQNPR